MLLLSAALWSFAYVFIKVALKEIPATTLVFIRLVLVAITFAALVAIQRQPMPRIRRRDIPALVVASAGGILGYNLLANLGLQYTTASAGSLLNAAVPVFTLALSCFLIGEKLAVHKVVGIGVALVGTVVVILKGGGDADIGFVHAFGALLILVGLLGWSIMAVLSKPLLSVYPTLFYTAVVSVIGGIMILPAVTLVRVEQVTALSWLAWASIAYLSIFSTVVGHVLWNYGLSKLDPSQVSVYLYLVPLGALVSANIFLGEAITLYLLLGGALIIFGVMLTNRSPANPRGKIEEKHHSTSSTPDKRSCVPTGRGRF